MITSMATWPATAMRTVFRRDTDYASSTWPSPAAAFLMDTEWFPQRVPGERGQGRVPSAGGLVVGRPGCATGVSALATRGAHLPGVT